jgi:hypothetical protein
LYVSLLLNRFVVAFLVLYPLFLIGNPTAGCQLGIVVHANT